MGAESAQKALQGYKTKMRELLEGANENIVSSPRTSFIQKASWKNSVSGQTYMMVHRLATGQLGLGEREKFYG